MGSKSDKTQKVQLTGVKETLLMTLYAKALDNRLEKPILNDQKADEMVNAIDYDFEKLIPKGEFRGDNLMVIRAKQIDEWIKEFLKKHPGAIVLNLGCGLDTRISRIGPSSETGSIILVSLHMFIKKPDYQFSHLIIFHGDRG